MPNLLDWITANLIFVLGAAGIIGLGIVLFAVHGIRSRKKSTYSKIEDKDFDELLPRRTGIKSGSAPEAEARESRSADSDERAESGSAMPKRITGPGNEYKEMEAITSVGRSDSPSRPTRIDSSDPISKSKNAEATSAPTAEPDNSEKAYPSELSAPGILHGRPPSPAEKVEFAVFTPKRIAPKSSFILDVWAYLPHQYPDIMEIGQSLGRDTPLARKPGVAVERGSILTIRTEIHELEVPEPVETIPWDGSPINASFIVNVPEGIGIGSRPGKVLVAYQGVTIAKIVFLITVAAESYFGYTDRSKSFHPRTAFASYASENRDEVLSRLQGMKKIAPDLEVFIDSISLRSGQNWLAKLEEHVPSKDIFYLFWSRPAARSEWVEREWRLALQKRGIEYIDPVPLEEPDFVPPPHELAALHFNDAYLAYIAYERLKKRNLGLN
ncbi:MAG: TIR domain-containing protein [Gammaproteobacteria bacterium]